MITGSACRKWGARGFRKMLRAKGLGGRRRNKEEEPRKRKTPASIEGKMRVAGGGKDSSLTLRMTVLVGRQNSE